MSNVRNLFPAYKVYIYGINVTPLCVSVRSNWPTGNPSQITIELVNPANLMTLTYEDIVNIAAMREGKNSAIAKAAKNDLFTSPILDQNGSLKYSSIDVDFSGLRFTPAPVGPPVTDALCKIKDAVIPKKIDRGRYTKSMTRLDGSLAAPELFFKYPFYQGKPIWHFSDPVRVAVRDPADPAIWYWWHGGTVTDVNERETEDMQSVLTVISEGVLKDLRNARVANMTGAYQTEQILGFTEEQLSIILSSVPFTNFLQNLTIHQILEIMIFGVRSLLDDLGQRIAEGITYEEATERFGLPPPTGNTKRTDKVTDKDVRAFESRLRGLNLSAMNTFKRWRRQQGTDIRILGAPMDSYDATIGVSTTLTQWQDLISNKVRMSDLQTMLIHYEQPEDSSNSSGRSVFPANDPAAVNMALGEVNAVLAAAELENVIERIGTDPDNYPIRQCVRMLLPAHLSSGLQRDLIEHDLAGCPAATAEFFDRLSMLQQIFDRIEFVLYDSPKGDIIVEMPLYDFEPVHFAPNQTNRLPFNPENAHLLSILVKPTYTLENFKEAMAATYAGLPLTSSQQAAYNSANAAKYVIATDDPLGPTYDYDFIVDKFSTISVDIASSEQDVKTMWVAKTRFLRNQAKDGSDAAQPPVYQILRNLIPLYGFRVEQGDPHGVIQNPVAARVYCNIMLNRTNADTTNLRVPIMPRFNAWPNRPYWITTRNYMATTKSVAHTIVWQSDCFTELGLWHVKLWDGRISGEGSEQRPLFVPFGGIGARPYNYAYLLEINDLKKDLNSLHNTSDAIASFLNQTASTTGGVQGAVTDLGQIQAMHAQMGKGK